MNTKRKAFRTSLIFAGDRAEYDRLYRRHKAELVFTVILLRKRIRRWEPDVVETDP